MKFLMLIALGPENRDFQDLPEEEQRAIYAGWKALNETPGVTPGQPLSPPDTATTVRVQDGRTVTTDGPYVGPDQALDGYFLYEAEDLDAAIALAARVPGAARGGAIEIRPLGQW
jgi:hypothetical protein